MNQPVQVTRLPSSAQRQLDALQAAEAAPPVTPPSGPVGVVTPAPVPPAPSAEAPPADAVTLTRAEYNELQAQAGRAQMAQDRLADLSTRLTELEAAAKGSTKPTETLAPTVQKLSTEGITFTEEENKEFEGSREFITKLVRLTVADAINPILQQLEAQLGEVKREATTAATTAGTVQKNSFKEALLAKVPDLPQLIGHKHWPAFCESEEPNTGYNYGQLLATAIESGKVQQAANIYKTFKERYGVQADNNTYTGVVPSGGAITPPAASTTTTKLKYSDRKKASEDYRMGRISYDKLQEVDKAFTEADKAGNVDYSS